MDFRGPLFIMLLFIFSSKPTSGQTIDTIYGCDEFPFRPYDCMLCTPQPFAGTTAPFNSSNSVTGFCGSIENDQYFGFVAGDVGFASFFITVDQCANFNGIQAAVFDGTGALAFDCYDEIVPGSGSLYSFNNLIQGEVYYLMIDGFAGDICNFTIEPFQGVEGPEALNFTPIVRNDNGTTQITTESAFSCLYSTGSNSTVFIDGCLYEGTWSISPNRTPFTIIQRPGYVEFT